MSARGGGCGNTSFSGLYISTSEEIVIELCLILPHMRLLLLSPLCTTRKRTSCVHARPQVSLRRTFVALLEMPSFNDSNRQDLLPNPCSHVSDSPLTFLPLSLLPKVLSVVNEAATVVQVNFPKPHLRIAMLKNLWVRGFYLIYKVW